MSGFIFDSDPGFLQCHGVTIERVPDGRVMAAWFAGTKEGNPDTAIWGAVLTDSKNWTRPRRLAKVWLGGAHWNPVLMSGPDGMLHMWFKVGKSPEEWRTYHMSSLDYDGWKWSRPKQLVRGKAGDGGRGPVRSKPIVLGNGTWLAPGSREVFSGYSTSNFFGIPKREVVWDSFVDVSADMGKTWDKSPPIVADRTVFGEHGGIIQPTLFKRSDGKIGMFMRSSYGAVFESHSADGRSWSAPLPTGLPNNNSAVDVVKLKCGLLVMCLNPVKGNWARRSPLSLIVSDNDGRSWHGPFHIETGEGSFSYPALLETNVGVAVAYTWNRLKIAYRELEIWPLERGATRYQCGEVFPNRRKSGK